MKKKQIRISVLLLGTAMLFSSCVPVPENVQQDVDALNQAREELKKLKKEMNYIKVSDVYEKTPKILEYKNGTLSFNARVCVPQAENAYKLKLEPNNLYLEKDTDISRFFLDGGASVAGKEMKLEQDVAEDERVFAPNGTEDKAYAGKGQCRIGFGEMKVDFDRCGLLFVRTYPPGYHEKHFIPFNGTKVNQEFFYNEIDDGLKGTVNIDGKNYELADFWNRFQKNVDYLKKQVPNFDYKPYYIGVYEEKDRETGALLKAVSCRAHYEYKDICFDDRFLIEQDKKNYDISRVDFGFFQNLHSVDDDCFYALRNSYKVIEELEKHDEILDLNSAISILQNSVAQATFTDIKTVELLYGMYYYGDEGSNWGSACETAPEFFAEPFWAFSTVTGTDRGAAFYINAVTGEFYGYSETMTGG